jgi:hypothetical protein
MNLDQAYQHLSHHHKKGVKFNELLNICKRFFPEYHIKGGHHIFKTPWQGPPWVNIQRYGHMAKTYQVTDVRHALEKLETIS